MVQFNTQKNEILVKIVYYGPGVCGKTTNLQYLHKLIADKSEAELFSVNTMEDRTLFFDLMPIEISAAGRKLKFQVYTVPGQVHYDSTRRIILAGADGIIFVADSDRQKMKENVESLNNLHKNLNANRLSIKTIPIVLQYNKRDLPDVVDLETIDKKLNFRRLKSFPSVAIEGKGVVETFAAVAEETIRHINKNHRLTSTESEADKIFSAVHESIMNLKANTLSENTAHHKTAITYEGSKGAVNENEVLTNALKATEETAVLYNEAKMLKEKLEKKNNELKSLLKENRYIKKFLESLFHYAGLPILTFNSKGKITNWNSECETLFGYTLEQAKSMNFSELIPEKSFLETQTMLSAVLKYKEVKKNTLNLSTSKGNVDSYKCVLSPILDESDIPIAVSVIITSSDMNRTDNKFISETVNNNIIHENIMLDNYVENSELTLALKDKKILILDPKKSVVLSFQKILTPVSNAKIDFALEKNEASRLLNIHNYDLIISSYFMPGLNGKAYFEWVSVEKPHFIPKTIFTSDQEFQQEAESMCLEYNMHFMTLPVQEDVLKDFVIKILA